jgi:hypothetical protein
MDIVQKNGYTLVGENGKPVEMDSLIHCFRGSLYCVQGGNPPHKPSSQGKIWVRSDGNNYLQEFYPSVFNCKWVEGA